MQIKKTLLVLIFLLFFSNIIKAQDYFVCVGAKLGYLWGKGEGSFNGGIEVSIVYWKNNDQLYPLGFVLDLDNISHLKSSRIHLGIEKNINMFGLDVGPTIMFGEEKNLGISIIPYAGFLLIPYGEFSFYNGYSTQAVGAYIKLPIKTNIKSFNLGG